MFLLKTEYFNKNLIIKGLITACLLSAFIYLSYFGFEIKLINTLFGLYGIYLLLTIPRVSLFYAGFRNCGGCGGSSRPRGKLLAGHRGTARDKPARLRCIRNADAGDDTRGLI